MTDERRLYAAHEQVPHHDHVEEADHRPDGDIDAAATGQDRRRTGQGGEQQRRREPDGREDPSRRQAGRVENRVEDQQHDQQAAHDDRPRASARHLSEGRHAELPAVPNMPSSTASRVSAARPSSARGAPSRNTMARWQWVTISSISVDSTTMATPDTVASSLEDREERQPGRVVDAAGRVIEQHRPRARLQQPRQQHLLLVAAAQAGDGRRGPRERDAKGLSMPLERRSRTPRADEPEAARSVERQDPEVVQDRHGREDAFGLAVLGQVHDAVAVGGARVGDRDQCCARVHRDRATRWGPQARKDLQECRLTVSVEARQSDDLAGVQVEVEGRRALTQPQTRTFEQDPLAHTPAGAMRLRRRAGDSASRSTWSTTRPLRRTVTRSEISMTSSMRWETKMMRTPSGAQAADDGEEGVPLQQPEGGGRFVEDEHARLPQERPGDDRDLLVVERRQTGLRARVDIGHAQLREQRTRPALLLVAGGPRPQVAVVAQEHVLGDRPVWARSGSPGTPSGRRGPVRRAGCTDASGRRRPRCSPNWARPRPRAP